MSMEKRIHRVKTSLGTCPTASFWNEANANLKRGDFQKVKKEKKKRIYEQNMEKEVWTTLPKTAGECRGYLVQTTESKFQAEFGLYFVNEDV